MKTMRYSAELIDVTDGDTVKLRADCGFRMFYEWGFRLKDINSPERNTSAGKAAKIWLTNFLKHRIDDGAILEIDVHKHGKYRWIVTLFCCTFSERINVNDKLVEVGHAVRRKY